MTDYVKKKSFVAHKHQGAICMLIHLIMKARFELDWLSVLYFKVLQFRLRNCEVSKDQILFPL